MKSNILEVSCSKKKIVNISTSDIKYMNSRSLMKFILKKSYEVLK